jgi:glycosyltransferase involved in cell wall biosynthesis
MKKKVLIISHDKVGSSMAGPGIRYHYMAEVLQKHFDVTLGFFGPENLPDDAFKRSYKVAHIDVHQFHKAFAATDYVVALWLSDAIIDFCNQHNKIVVFDIYAPVPVENLAVKVFSGKKITEEDDFAFMKQLQDYRKFLQNGDAFLYSNQRQLDYWIGYAFGADQVSPSTFIKRNIYNQFLLAPMGIDSAQPLKKTKTLYKGKTKGINPDDILMVWNGGIYDWYDGVTLIDAMEIVAKHNPKIKMIFPGIHHPNSTMRQWQETVDTVHRAEQKGLDGKNVFFFENWVPYYDRVNFLLEADIAIYTHKPSIEMEFSHRTRVIDSHIFGILPTIATEGDYFSDLLEPTGMGKAVPAYNAKALADAIVELAKPDNLKTAKANVKRIRPDYDWHKTLEPLTNYLLSNPKKVVQVAPLQTKPAPLQNRHLARAKRYTPKVVKKAVLKAMPAPVKRKLIKR